MAKKKLDIGILEIKKVVVETPLKKSSDLGWSETPTSETIPRPLNEVEDTNLWSIVLY